jgi:hypothetical protein
MEQLKIMVTSNSGSVLWNVQTESAIQIDHLSYKILGSVLDIAKWQDNYYKLYLEWLHDDDESIYDINHPINVEIVNSLIKVNNIASNFKIYFWFDVDRDKYPKFIWKVCPMSGMQLISLPHNFHLNNRKISPLFPLIFP